MKEQRHNLPRTASHRKALLMDLGSQLIMHKRITTTLAKAKALRTYIEPLISKTKNTQSKEVIMYNQRIVFSYLNDKAAVKELFTNIAPKVAARPGGYTRITRLGARTGDNTEIAMIELIDFSEIYGKINTPQSKTKRLIPAHIKAETAAESGFKTRRTGNFIVGSGLLGKAADKPENHMTIFEKIQRMEDGITKSELENLKQRIGLDYNQLAKILDAARTTLINKKGTEKFDRTVSERIIALADIYSYGYEVFEDESVFSQWIFRSNKALNGLSPYDLLNSQYGREEIKNLIGRIDYGVYS